LKTNIGLIPLNGNLKIDHENMKNMTEQWDIPLAEPEIMLEIKQFPRMPQVFAKALLKSLGRGNALKANATVKKFRIVLNRHMPDKKVIRQYNVLCGFQQDTIPVSYFQTLFTGLLGKYITSHFFPITPLGLIHTGQFFEQARPVLQKEILDLSCSLQEMTQTKKGIQTRFLLEVKSDHEIVWKGISTFFTKSGIKPGVKKKQTTREEIFLETRKIIKVPADMGRQYAKISGDYNPHHLSGITAKFFGFKKPIAHGMWTLARTLACLEESFGIHYPLIVQASFKLPVFMPAIIALGYESPKTAEESGTDQMFRTRPGHGKTDACQWINFELRDEKSKLPHLKGSLSF